MDFRKLRLSFGKQGADECPIPRNGHDSRDFNLAPAWLVASAYRPGAGRDRSAGGRHLVAASTTIGTPSPPLSTAVSEMEKAASPASTRPPGSEADFTGLCGTSDPLITGSKPATHLPLGSAGRKGLLVGGPFSHCDPDRGSSLPRSSPMG